jgi:hypothetical protein
VTGLALTLILLAGPTLAGGPAQELHGADSVFARHGVAIAWGVLRAEVEAETQVIIRIAPLQQAYAFLSVQAVDPFTQERRHVLDGEPLKDRVDIRSLRTSFTDFPRREFQLYRTADDWRAGTPSLLVYYLGVPDTTPEFNSEAALFAYLAATVAKFQAPAR